MAKRLWAGLDIGVETTSICVIDDSGETVHEAVCPTLLKDVHREIGFLKRLRHARVGMEAGMGSSLARGLRKLGYSVDIYETRQLSKFLRLRRNKTDAGDANGIAQAGRLGAPLVSKVYLKSLDNQFLCSRLAIRRQLVRARTQTANLLCCQLELYGGRVRRNPTAGKKFRSDIEFQIQKLFGPRPTPITVELHYLLDRCEELFKHQRQIDREFNRMALEDDVCRRFMAIPGVGAICALTFVAAIGEPHRFNRAASVGSYLGLTPRVYQSGLTQRFGRISKMGSAAARSLLVTSSVRFMASKTAPPSDLRDWATGLAERRGKGKANVALARKLASIMLSMWKSGEPFRSTSSRLSADAGVVGATGPDLGIFDDAARARRYDNEAGPRRHRRSIGPGRPMFRLPKRSPGFARALSISNAV